MQQQVTSEPETIYTVAARALFELYRPDAQWPLDLLELYILDSIGPRHWVDFPGLIDFEQNLLSWTSESGGRRASSLGNDMSCEAGNASNEDDNEEEVIEEGTISPGPRMGPSDGASLNRNAVANRYCDHMAETTEMILNALRTPTNNIISGASAGSQSVILSLSSFSKLSEVRAIAVNCLPRLLGQVSAAPEIKRLLYAIVNNLEVEMIPASTTGFSPYKSYFASSALEPSDMTVVSQVVKIRSELKPSQQEMYRSLLCRLAVRGAPVGRLVLRVLIESEILTPGTTSSKSETLKLIMQIFKAIESGVEATSSANPPNEVKNRKKRQDSISCTLFGLAIHDILVSRLQLRAVSSMASSISTHVWDYARENSLLDIIVKVLRLMDVKKISLSAFLSHVLMSPSIVCKVLDETSGHLPNVDATTGLRKFDDAMMLQEGATDTAHRRKVLSDVLWTISEISKILQVNFP